MSVLNLNNLTIEQVKILNDISIEIKDDFNKLSEKIFQNSNKTIGILLHTILSRNPYQSSLFINVCNVLLVLEILNSQNDIDKVIVKNEIQKKILDKQLDNSQIIINTNKRERFSFISYIHSIFRLVLLVKKGLSLKKSSRSKYISKKKNITIIDTFILEKSIQEGKYFDRYYTDILNYVENDENIFWLPTILGKVNKKQLDNIQKNSVENFVFKEDFLKKIDYFYAIRELLRMKLVPNTSYYVSGIDFTDIIIDEFRKNRFYGSTYSGLINYFFVKRLKEKKISINLLIDWNENQPIDKGLIKGFRNFYPKTYIKGYQGYIISTDYNFYIQPIDFEIKNNVIPDEICVVGKALEKSVKRFSENVKVITSPAFRFSNVYKNYKRLDNNYRILIALPIGMDESIDILNLFYDAFHGRNISYEIQIKPHPMLNIDKLKSKLGSKWNNGYNVIDGDFNERVAQVDVLIGSTSSTLLETILKGIPVVVIGSKNGITQNPIPKYLLKDDWRICYTGEEIYAFVISYIDKRRSMELNNKELKGLLSRYFEKPTEENIKIFLNR